MDAYAGNSGRMGAPLNKGMRCHPNSCSRVIKQATTSDEYWWDGRPACLNVTGNPAFCVALSHQSKDAACSKAHRHQYVASTISSYGFLQLRGNRVFSSSKCPTAISIGTKKLSGIANSSTTPS